MGRRAKRAADLASLVGKAYESALAPVPFADFLPAVTEAFGADAALISLYAPELGKGAIPVAHRLPAEAQRAYGEHFWAIDPWRIEYQRRRIKGAATGAELVPFAAFARTEIYNDRLRRDDFFDTCCAEIHASGTAGAAISILRAHRRPFFDRRSAALLDRLLPHLAGAFALHRRAAVLIAQRTALASLIDGALGGALLCDAAGNIAYASVAARRLLDRGTILYLARGRLAARDPAADAALTRIFSAPSSGGGAASHSIAARGRDGGGVRLTILRAVANTILDPQVDGIAYQVLIEANAEGPTNDIDRVADRHGLTPAEARLARLLAGGASLKDAAERLGVSINTVRTHLRQVFQKTGVSRQAELIRLLLSTR